MSETLVYRATQKFTKDRDGRYTRIENAASAGVPDVNINIGGHEMWIECKETKTQTVKIRPSQLMWAMEQAKAGGNWFCLVKFPGGFAVGTNNHILRLQKPLNVFEMHTFESCFEALEFIFHY